jgi:hypothetical protein
MVIPETMADIRAFGLSADRIYTEFSQQFSYFKRRRIRDILFKPGRQSIYHL